MKITTPEKQLSKYAELYYVSSEANPNDKSEHIVVRQKKSGQLFCDCRDFIIRHLPDLETGLTSCKHGKFVESVLQTVPPGFRLVIGDELRTVVERVTNKAKYGVFYGKSRSIDFPDTYDSREDAELAIAKDRIVRREVKELEGV